MTQYTEIYTIRITAIQKKTLEKLVNYNVNVAQFIRLAIKEKISRDYKNITESKEKVICPF